MSDSQGIEPLPWKICSQQCMCLNINTKHTHKTTKSWMQTHKHMHNGWRALPVCPLYASCVFMRWDWREGTELQYLYIKRLTQQWMCESLWMLEKTQGALYFFHLVGFVMEAVWQDKISSCWHVCNQYSDCTNVFCCFIEQLCTVWVNADVPHWINLFISHSDK